MESNILFDLQKTGWIKSHLVADDIKALKKSIVSMALQLGTPIPRKAGMVEEVFPKRKDEASFNSLSGRYGLGSFPLHCDTSQWTVPCRFVLLACVDPSPVPVPTLLLDTNEIALSPEEREVGMSSVFLVKSGRKSFYSSILSRRRNFVRYDPGCMMAIDNEGKEAIKLYCHAVRKDIVLEVYLDSGDVLIVDNWRVLHGRGECPQASRNRMLLRILCDE